MEEINLFTKTFYFKRRTNYIVLPTVELVLMCSTSTGLAMAGLHTSTAGGNRQMVRTYSKQQLTGNLC